MRVDMTSNPREKKSVGQKFENLLTVAGAILCICTIMGFLCCYSWFLDLFSHFRVHYFIGLLFIAISFLLIRNGKKFLVMTFFALINFLLVIPYYIPDSIPEHSDSNIKTMLINVNSSLGNPEKVKEAIKTSNPDFIVLEEISSKWVKKLESLKKDYPYFLIKKREDNFGIALFSRLPLQDKKIVKIGSAGVPTIEAILQTKMGNLKVIATHPLPPVNQDYTSWRNEQLNKLGQVKGDGNPLIIMGDLNCTPWSHHFKNLIKTSGLKNSMKGFGIQPTWPAHFLLLGVPIDHLLHSKDIFIRSRRTGPDISSDHLPLIVDFSINAKSNAQTGN